MVQEEGKVEVPIIQQEFAEHLGKYRVKREMVDTIAENIAEVGGPIVFEDPEALNRNLVNWSQYIGATLRKQILDHWFAKKGIAVSAEVAKKFVLTSTEAVEADKRGKKERDALEGGVWVVKQDAKGVPRIAMASDDETGITLEEATKAVEEIRKSYVGDEPLVIFDEGTQKHTPNFKSEFVKANPTIAWAAAKSMDKAMAEGTELDPLEVMVASMARIEEVRQVIAPSRDAETKGTIKELIDGVKQLQEMGKEGKVDVPAWLSDPVAFIETVQRISGGGGGGAPGWLSDPAQFIAMVRTISPEPKADQGLKEELTELRKTMDEMREATHRQEIAAQQQQIQALTSKVGELVDKVTDLSKPVTGRTEMDIIHEIASQGIGVIRTELPGLRKDVKEAFGSVALPGTKSTEDRERRKGKYREALEEDKTIDELGRRLFFGEE